MVTPVSTELHEHMSLIEGGTAEAFIKKCLTGIAFLQQIKSDEVSFCEGHHARDIVLFYAALVENRIPSVFKRAATQ